MSVRSKSIRVIIVSALALLLAALAAACLIKDYERGTAAPPRVAAARQYAHGEAGYSVEFIPWDAAKY